MWSTVGAVRKLPHALPMPRRNYGTGVNSYGDHARVVREGLELIDRYRGLGAIIASRSRGETFDEVERFAREKRTTPHRIFTEAIEGSRARDATIRDNIRDIMRLLPGREGSSWCGPRDGRKQIESGAPQLIRTEPAPGHYGPGDFADQVDLAAGTGLGKDAAQILPRAAFGDAELLCRLPHARPVMEQRRESRL